MIDSSNQILEEELLPDPLGDRKIGSVPRLPNKELERHRVYGGENVELPNTELIRMFQNA